MLTGTQRRLNSVQINESYNVQQPGSRRVKAKVQFQPFRGSRASYHAQLAAPLPRKIAREGATGPRPRSTHTVSPAPHTAGAAAATRRQSLTTPRTPACPTRSCPCPMHCTHVEHQQSPRAGRTTPWLRTWRLSTCNTLTLDVRRSYPFSVHYTVSCWVPALCAATGHARSRLLHVPYCTFGVQFTSRRRSRVAHVISPLGPTSRSTLFSLPPPPAGQPGPSTPPATPRPHNPMPVLRPRLLPTHTCTT